MSERIQITVTVSKATHALILFLLECEQQELPKGVGATVLSSVESIATSALRAGIYHLAQSKVTERGFNRMLARVGCAPGGPVPALQYCSGDK